MRPSSVAVSVSGPADPKTVWQRYLQPRRWAAWSPQIRSVEYTHPTLRPGTRGIVRTFGGVGVPFVIEEVDPSERTWSWRVDVGALSLVMDHGVSAADEGGTRTWLRVTGPPGISHVYAHAAAVIALRRLVRP